MIPKLQISRVEDTLEWMETALTNAPAAQSIDWLNEHIAALCGYMPFANGQMAVANKELNEAKEKAYAQLILGSIELSPSIMKSFAGAKCSQQQYHYDVCERLSRTIVHQLDALRSVLSALKEEIKIAGYQQNH